VCKRRKEKKHIERKRTQIISIGLQRIEQRELYLTMDRRERQREDNSLERERNG